MKIEKHDDCTCPRCQGHIPAQFYCRACGYLPDWRQITAAEDYEIRKEAA